MCESLKPGLQAVRRRSSCTEKLWSWRQSKAGRYRLLRLKWERDRSKESLANTNQNGSTRINIIALKCQS